MPNVARVMLCDDSAVMRRLIRTALKAEPSIEVVAEAGNGEEALAQLFDARPDVLIMDVEMPVMDGIDCVRAVRRLTTQLPIIMFSSLTAGGAEATLDAIEAGATDFATKPASVGHIAEAMAHVREALVTKIRQCLGLPGQAVEPEQVPATDTIRAAPLQLGTSPAYSGPTPPQRSADTSSGNVTGPIHAIGVGVSTGGPQALSRLVKALPVDLAVPILVVQHMPPVFTRLLAQRLSAQNGHRVREAVNAEELRPGEILIAPGDHHLLAVRDRNTIRTSLNQEPPENSCRPAVDPLFRSMADCYGNRCLGVVLTGMGKDGAGGAKALQDKGARVYVQDQESSVVWGMPGHIVECGLADRILPIEQIAHELIRATSPKPVGAV